MLYTKKTHLLLCSQESLSSITHSSTLDFFNTYVVLIRIIRWSTSVENKDAEKEIHNLLAESYRSQNSFGKAQSHYLRGTKVDDFCDMLCLWSKTVLPSERDLLITRAVLQLNH